MRNAFVTIRELPAYRRDAFVAGLKRCGFRVSYAIPDACDPGDVFLTWNRYAHYERAAQRVAAGGGIVLVAENGVIGADREGRPLYQLARDHHAGFGTWHEGVEDRWSRLEIELAPWRERGDHILVCAQRGIGSPPVKSPQQDDFFDDMRARLPAFTDRPLVLRRHPSVSKEATVPLAEQLRNAWAVVIWCSNVGAAALVAGIPVFYVAPRWILEGAAERDLARIERPFTGDRLSAFRRMAWAQWTIDELASGEPFHALTA